MNVVKKKLNNVRGASMLIALIYLLTALMVGTVVLVAASSNVGRITHNRQDQREYYAVESAMELVRADMALEHFRAEYSKVDEYDWAAPEYNEGTGELIRDGYYYCSDTDYTDASELTDSGLLETQLSAFEANYFSGAVYGNISEKYTEPAVMEYELNFAAGGDASDKIPEVSGTLTVDQDTYDVTVTLYAADTNGNQSNPVTMSFEALVKNDSSTSGSESGGSITKTHEITVTWGEPSIRKGVA